MPERILLVIDHLQIGGAQRHVLALAGALTERGHQVLLAHTGKTAWPAPAELVQLMPVPLEHAVSARLECRLVEVAEAWRPSVIHAHLFSSIVAAASAGHSLGIPVVATHHSAGTWQTPAERNRFGLALRELAWHLAVSPQIAASVVAAGVPAERVDYVPNAVALPAASSPAHRGSDVRVGFLGRLCPDKDPVTALRALAVARSHTTPEVTLHLGGDGPMHGAVVREKERLHLTPYVRLAGTILDVTAFMRHIDIFLLSSRSEGTPLAVLEAMGHGLPVVATGVGGVPLQVEDGVTGLIAPAGDHAALGRALAWIAEHPEEGLAMGRAGRRRLLRDFSLDTLVTQVEAVYTRSALARPEPAELAG